MDDADFEPDPRRRVPAVVWLALGLVLMAAFAAVVFLLLGHGAPHTVGPPPGTPD